MRVPWEATTCGRNTGLWSMEKASWGSFGDVGALDFLQETRREAETFPYGMLVGQHFHSLPRAAKKTSVVKWTISPGIFFKGLKTLQIHNDRNSDGGSQPPSEQHCKGRELSNICASLPQKVHCGAGKPSSTNNTNNRRFFFFFFTVKAAMLAKSEMSWLNSLEMMVCVNSWGLPLVRMPSLPGWNHTFHLN